MWPPVAAIPSQHHLRTLFVPFATAIRHSGEEHYEYLANQKLFVSSSDVTSLQLKVAREGLPLPVHLLPNTAERKNAGGMQDETDLVSGEMCLWITARRKHSKSPTVPILNNLTFRNWFLVHLDCSPVLTRVSYRRDRDARMDHLTSPCQRCCRQTACTFAAGSKMYA